MCLIKYFSLWVAFFSLQKVLIIVLVIGSIIISSGFITNQEIIEISEISTQYEHLEKYKNELERINQ